MEEGNKNANTFEIEFCFEDDDCHDIDGQVLTNYLLLLNCFCKEKKCDYSLSPPEKASYKQKVNFTPKEGKRGLGTFSVDCIESLFKKTDFKTAEGFCEATGSAVSTFFKSVTNNVKKIKSIVLTQINSNGTKTQTIEEKDFYNYIIEEEERIETKRKTIDVEIKKVEITESGSICIREEDKKKIKEMKTYKEIMNDFKNVNYHEHEHKKEVLNLFNYK